MRNPVPTESNASSASRISDCTFSEHGPNSLSKLGVLCRLGGVGGNIGNGIVISSLSGWISKASRRSKVNFVGLGSDLTDFFCLVPVGSFGDGRGFSRGDPGGEEILLSLFGFDRIDECPGDSPGLRSRGSRRGDPCPAACCSQLHKELLEECGVSGKGGRCVILCKSLLLRMTIIGCGTFFVDDFDIQPLLLRRLRLSTFKDGLGFPGPSVTFKFAFSSLSQKRSSSECRL